MPNELRKPTIDEAIDYSLKQANQCRHDGFAALASYWGGYHDALADVKNGGFDLEQESKR
jgi:hypothetical protein